MMRKFALSLLGLGALMSTSSMAMTHNLARGLSVDYELPVNSPEIFTNFTIFKLHAVCRVHTQDPATVIHVKALNRSGQVNGQVINTGDELDLQIHNGESFDLIAESAAQVELTNKGAHPIKATCQLG